MIDLKINDKLHGFELKKISEVAEISSKTFEFEHLKTGAKLFYVAAARQMMTTKFFISPSAHRRKMTQALHILSNIPRFAAVENIR